MVAHAFGKITLFFAAGAIYVASKKTDIAQLAGIGRRMPWTMTAFTIGALSMIGVPPTGGFVSKWYILAGAFQSNNYVAIFTIIASTVLNAAYFLPIIFAAWFGREATDGAKDHGEAPLAAVLALTITAALTILFFLFNGPVIALEKQLLEFAL
jgi:multicomponent Na+:H+ antiporter subunit D